MVDTRRLAEFRGFLAENAVQNRMRRLPQVGAAVGEPGALRGNIDDLAVLSVCGEMLEFPCQFRSTQIIRTSAKLCPSCFIVTLGAAI